MTTTSPAAPGRYAFDNATPEAAQQVRLLAEILDEHTTNVLARENVERGAHCLDVGSGAGTIALWLADEVGPTGSVVAFDQDPRHIPTHDLINIQMGDATAADFGTDRYDVVHARLVLMHLPTRIQVLRRLVAALKPGGLLVVSDWDCTQLDRMLLTGSPQLREAFLAFQLALVAYGAANGMSADWAQRAPQALLTAGMVEVTAEQHNRMWRGGEPGCLLHASNSRQLQSQLLAHGGVTAAQLETVREGMTDPDTVAWSYLMVTSTGRRADN